MPNMVLFPASSVYSRKRPVRAIRLSVDPGDRERGTVYSRWTTDERVGRHVREQVCRYSRIPDHLFQASSLLGYNLVLRMGSAIEAVVRI